MLVSSLLPQIFYCAVLHNAFPAPQWQPFIALQINTRDAAAQVWNVRSVLARLQIRRCVASGPHCWAMWIGLMRAELTKRLDVKPAGIRGGGDHRNTTPEYWIDGPNTAALKAPRRKTPCRSRALLV